MHTYSLARKQARARAACGSPASLGLLDSRTCAPALCAATRESVGQSARRKQWVGQPAAPACHPVLTLSANAQEPAPAMLQGPASPASPAPDRSAHGGGARRRSNPDGNNPMQLRYLEEHDAAVAEAGGRGAGHTGGLEGAWSARRGWRGSLQRTSMQLREGLLGVPDGALPMGDATGQAAPSRRPRPARAGVPGSTSAGLLVALTPCATCCYADRCGSASDGGCNAVWLHGARGSHVCILVMAVRARAPPAARRTQPALRLVPCIVRLGQFSAPRCIGDGDIPTQILTLDLCLAMPRWSTSGCGGCGMRPRARPRARAPSCAACAAPPSARCTLSRPTWPCQPVRPSSPPPRAPTNTGLACPAWAAVPATACIPRSSARRARARPALQARARSWACRAAA